MDYEALVRSRLCIPLGMTSTFIAPPPEIKPRLATGHSALLTPVSSWDLPTLAGGGALRSTVNDMLVFLAANLGYTESPLAPAMGAMLEVCRPAGGAGLEIALGWHLFSTGSRQIIWHNGSTNGFRSFAGYAPRTGVGVVVLSNTETSAGIDDIGRHLIDPGFPLLEIAPPRERQQVSTETRVLDGYTGRYELLPNFILTVTREDARLFVQATGQPKFEVYAESDRDFFLKAIDTQIRFETDNQGRATGLVLRQNSIVRHAQRIE
jgi:CubicO group peptidase (beta-lactamase class C family)